MSQEYEIRSLANTSFEVLYACHIEAFKDYPFQWSKQALQKTIHRRGFDPALSFGAFHQEQLVAFTWNGTGVFNGYSTAYDTGTGTIEAHRGKGLASQIFEYSIPYLKEKGIEQYILEVLEENEKAISVYSRQGFNTSRKFDCFRSNMADWQLNVRPADNAIHFKEIGFSYRTQMEAMIDFPLSWQNDFPALLRQPEDFVVIGAFRDEQLVGYGIVEPAGGDIPQLAVARDERRKGIGTALLFELRKLIKADIVKVVNIEAGQTAIINFVTGNGIPKIVRQYEMTRKL